jgi:hypothetical protein
MEKRGEVAYQSELLPQLLDVHNVFHVSELKKYLHVPEEQIPMEDLDAREDLSYHEYLVKIQEMSKRVTRHKRIQMCKVQWSHHAEEEATWEREEELKAEFPIFFLICSNLGDEIYFKGGRFVTPYLLQKNKALEITFLNK